MIESISLSPDGEWIAFDSNRRGQFDIFKQPLEGGPPRLVADLRGIVFEPSWSPDGYEIAFHSGFGSGEVFVVSADGGTPQQLTDYPGQDSRPDWSPDGLSIAFDSEDASWNVRIVSRDSTGMPWSDPVQVTDFGCIAADWAPDGRSLVCRPARSAGYGIGFVRVSREGEVLSSILMPPSFTSVWLPRFSSDGSRIYFRGTQEDGSQGVWWIPADGGDVTRVVAFDDPSLTVWGVEVGQENLYLAFSEVESDIWVMDLDW